MQPPLPYTHCATNTPTQDFTQPCSPHAPPHHASQHESPSHPPRGRPPRRWQLNTFDALVPPRRGAQFDVLLNGGRVRWRFTSSRALHVSHIFYPCSVVLALCPLPTFAAAARPDSSIPSRNFLRMTNNAFFYKNNKTRLPPPILLSTPQTFLPPAEVQERILNVIKNFDKIDPAKVQPTSKFGDDLGLDSLDAVEVVMAIEDEFAIEIPDAEADRIGSVSDAVEYVSAHPMAK
ncbi:hypothetical protein ACHAXA_003711 [Cyclostephanos tholiformis]|uniref:Acyl carrier protein n=1 Tax=Cyclostephanos tholiformis TaxID=382380 RepID=A0ABD3RZ71_9STRA